MTILGWIIVGLIAGEMYVSLAGIGPDRTRLQIWADPTLERNTHTIKVDADSARFEMTIENVPSVEKYKILL